MKHEEIGGHTFGVNKWNASKAIKLQLKLVKVCGASIVSFISSAGKSDKIQEDAMANSMMLLFSNSNEDEILSLIKEISCSAIRDGQKMQEVKFDEYFTDSILDAYKVFIFVLKEQYSDFFDFASKVGLK